MNPKIYHQSSPDSGLTPMSMMRPNSFHVLTKTRWVIWKSSPLSRQSGQQCSHSHKARDDTTIAKVQHRVHGVRSFANVSNGDIWR